MDDNKDTYDNSQARGLNPSADETPDQAGSEDATDTSPVPVADSSDAPTAPVPPAPSKKKRKGLIIGIIIATILVILGVGTALGYTFWYQNPEKVVTDGIMNAFKAKTVTYTGSVDLSGDIKLKVELTGANKATTSDAAAKVTFPIDGKDYSFRAAARFDKNGDLFFKVKDIQSIVDVYSQAMPAESVSVVNKLVAKINDRWIKLGADDLAQYDESVSKKQKCVSDAIEKYFQDDKALAEVAEVYKKNKFVTAKQDLGNRDGSLGYSLAVDESRAKEFYKGLKDTKVYKSLHECDPEIKIDEEESAKQTTENDKKTENKFELWVDMWTHQITEIKATSKEKDTGGVSTAILKPKFNEEVTVEAPKDSISLKQLQAEIEELVMSAAAAQTPTLEEMESAPFEESDFSNET